MRVPTTPRALLRALLIFEIGHGSLESPRPTFTRTLNTVDMRLLIESSSNGCGQSNLVSEFDGSLERWEEQHVCGAAGTEDGVPHRQNSA